MKYLKCQAVPSPDPSAMTLKQALASCSTIKQSIKKGVEATEKMADHWLTGFLCYFPLWVLNAGQMIKKPILLGGEFKAQFQDRTNAHLHEGLKSGRRIVYDGIVVSISGLD